MRKLLLKAMRRVHQLRKEKYLGMIDSLAHRMDDGSVTMET
jgi:hypothetical protein